MNFLAHLFLAGGAPESIIGNLMGDFVQGVDVGAYPEAVRAGIRMHQRVDSFTDANAIVIRSKKRMPPPYRRYAGVLVDVFYDHFLAVGWRDYSPETSLDDFAQRTYGVLTQNQDRLPPPRLRRIVPFMVEQNWLGRYQTVEGVRRTLQGLSRRLKRQNPLPEGVSQLEQHYGRLNSDFIEFFPQLITYADHLRTRNPSHPRASQRARQLAGPCRRPPRVVG